MINVFDLEITAVDSGLTEKHQVRTIIHPRSFTQIPYTLLF